MKTRLSIAALLGILFTAPAVAQVDSAAICKGQDAEFNIAAGAKTGGTALHTAAEANACESAARLIAKGANVHLRDSLGLTPLHYASEKKTVELLVAHGADVNAHDNGFGWSPLDIAASNNSIEIAKLLIANGAVIDSRDKHLNTPLSSAAFSNAVEVAELLLANGANVNAHDILGMTPLDEALDKGHKEMIELLRVHGGGCNKNC